jgi:hypothetical protein
MREDVVWANGLKGGFIYGRDNVREYWRRQFETLDPRLEPLEFSADGENQTIVRLRQIVNDAAGNLLVDQTVEHILTLENDLIKTFEIGDFTAPSAGRDR